MDKVMNPVGAMMELDMARRMRRPKHRFNVTTRPFGIYPFCIAPVLPRETLQYLNIQSRVVTDPTVSRVIGWYKEYYFFYVKIRDLIAVDGGTDFATPFTSMVLDPANTMSSVETNTDIASHMFAPPGAVAGLDWVGQCLRRVTSCYFREQDEGTTQLTGEYAFDSGNIPKAKIVDTDMWDSYGLASEIPTAALTGNAEDLNDVEQKWRAWMLARSQHLTDMTFEDYLATFGVKLPGHGKDKPELIGRVKEWQYPSNTVEPTTGVPTSAVSWSIADRLSKNIFFAEPGFVFGVTIVRPKVYRASQATAAVSVLRDAYAWMPALLKDDPSSSLVYQANAAAGDIINVGAEHVFDRRDLFVHGDQFLYNADPVLDVEGESHSMGVIDGSRYGWQYVTTANINKLFADRTPGEKIYCREDGVVQLGILGTQVDMT